MRHSAPLYRRVIFLGSFSKFSLYIYIIYYIYWMPTPSFGHSRTLNRREQDREAVLMVERGEERLGNARCNSCRNPNIGNRFRGCFRVPSVDVPGGKCANCHRHGSLPCAYSLTSVVPAHAVPSPAIPALAIQSPAIAAQPVQGMLQCPPWTRQGENVRTDGSLPCAYGQAPVVDLRPI